MEQSVRNTLIGVRDYLIIAIGMLIYSFSWVGILLPAKVMGGGVSGIGMLIFYATGEAIPIGYSYFVINAILIAIGILIIGPQFGAKTFFAMIFNSVALVLLQEYMPSDILGLAGDKLLSAILGGAICGTGIGICFSRGGSTGGTDIIAMIVNKFHDISIGKVIILCDIIIVGCSYFVFKDITSIVYGYITMAVVGYSLDLFMQGNQQSCQLMVFSMQYDQICNRIVNEANRGVTLLDATGWYTKRPLKVILVLCRKQEMANVYRIIKEVDAGAFISSTLVTGVYGNGFDRLKTKVKKRDNNETK